MSRCSCGAEPSPGADWCWLCYAPGTVRTRVAVAEAPEHNRVVLDDEPAVRDAVAGWITAAAIATGAVFAAIVWAITSPGSIEPGHAIRLALVFTLAQYGVVSVLVLGRAATSAVRPRWAIGPAWRGAMCGFVLGAVAAGLLVGVMSAVSGAVGTDPRFLVLLSEGGAVRVATVGFIAVVAAPLIEELLFRGLLAESLRHKGRNSALVLSAIGFAVWHLQPESLRYYVLMGFLLGLLYWRFGLAGSIGAHAAFNGVLFLAAMLALHGPAQDVSFGAGRLRVPSGWSRARAAPSPSVDLVVAGPSGSGLVVEHATDAAPSPAQLVDGFRHGLPGPAAGARIDPDSVTEATYPAGPAVRMIVAIEGHRADSVVFPRRGGIWVFTLVTAGSPRAYHDFENILRSVRFEY